MRFASQANDKTKPTINKIKPVNNYSPMTSSNSIYYMFIPIVYI